MFAFCLFICFAQLLLQIKHCKSRQTHLGAVLHHTLAALCVYAVSIAQGKRDLRVRCLVQNHMIRSWTHSAEIQSHMLLQLNCSLLPPLMLCFDAWSSLTLQGLQVFITLPLFINIFFYLKRR